MLATHDVHRGLIAYAPSRIQELNTILGTDTLVCDLLTDLMHAIGEDRFERQLDMARIHYTAETALG